MPTPTIEDLRSLLQLDHTADDAHLQECLSSGIAAVEEITGRTFDAPSGTSVDRSYVPESATVVRIDDLADLTSVTVVSYGTTLTTGLQWEPLNGLGPDRRYRPYDTLRLTSGYFTQLCGEATVTITSTRWGWTDVPDRVSMAMLHAAKDLWDLGASRFGVAGFGDLGLARVRENPAILSLLQGYRSHRTIGIG